jgi:hypothetical protein
MTAQLAAQRLTAQTSSGTSHSLLHKQMIDFDAAKLKTDTLWCMTDFIDSEATHNESVITVVNACPKKN